MTQQVSCILIILRGLESRYTKKKYYSLSVEHQWIDIGKFKFVASIRYKGMYSVNVSKKEAWFQSYDQEENSIPALPLISLYPFVMFCSCPSFPGLTPFITQKHQEYALIATQASSYIKTTIFAKNFFFKSIKTWKSSFVCPEQLLQ